MKVTLRTNTAEFGEERHELLVDNGPRHYIGPLCECPEDAIIGRSLIDGYDLLNLIKIAHVAGKAGEALEIVEEALDD